MRGVVRCPAARRQHFVSSHPFVKGSTVIRPGLASSYGPAPSYPSSRRSIRTQVVPSQLQPLGPRPSSIRFSSSVHMPSDMLVTEKFTPEVMLGAPRRSPAVPNHDGTLALYTVSSYDFAEGKKSKELKVME